MIVFPGSLSSSLLIEQVKSQPTATSEPSAGEGAKHYPQERPILFSRLIPTRRRSHSQRTTLSTACHCQPRTDG
jgi:hypothetical protein